MGKFLRSFLRAIRFLLSFSCIFLISEISYAQTYWVGNISSDYYTKDNWSNNTMDWANLTAVTLMIGKGAPSNCVHTGGNSSNVNYRPAKLNVLSDGEFTISGAIYPNNSDSLNGIITLNAPADLNVRNIVYMGRSKTAKVTINGGKLSSKNAFYIATGTNGNAIVDMPGGAIYVGTNLEVANGAGLIAQVNLSGGSIYIPGNLNIGSGGNIHITGLGLLSLTGDKRTVINNYINSGRITCTGGKQLSVDYNGTNTLVAIAQNPNSMITEYSSYVILKNSVLEAKIDKGAGNIQSLKVNGKELCATVNTANPTRIGAYYDFTTSKGFETIFGATYSVKRDEADVVDVSFKRPYKPGSNVTSCDADIHFVLKKDDPGLYTYSILEHPATYPAFDLGSWRQVLWIAPDPTNSTDYLCERIYADSLRNWQMPSLYDFSQASATGIAEIVKLNTGVRAGKYDGKYQFSMPFWENPVWGHASNKNNVGTWFVNGSLEYFNEGPTFHDLNAAAGIIHSCMNGVHYDATGFNVPQGEYWTKIYGPYLIYGSSKSTGDANWLDAKARAAVEKSQWPYSWLTNTPQYPLANERGTITGKFIINDPFKPTVKGQNAWVGVTILSSDANNQFQFEEKNYQYWVKTDVAGNFSIPNVRPGTYSFFGFSDGVTGNYTQANVTVTANSTTALGDVTWDIVRDKGNLLWEVGYPNRKASEFKLGDFDYCEGHVQEKFRDTFPEIIEYDVASKDWPNKLCYAHTGYPNITGGLGQWKWRLNFTLPAGIPTTGNATLTIAYASSDHAQEWIYVNNENSTFVTYYPDNAGGNAFLRQSNYAKYSVKAVSIPMSRLKAGANTITLLMPSTSSTVNHVMYDYISLEAPVVLPVSLVSFGAIAEDAQVKLNWVTASERNNARFEIERSVDGVHYSVIAKMKGAGTTMQTQRYTALDAKPQPGNNYYRLIQYDQDGAASEQGIQVVKFNNLSTSSLGIYPNPSEGVFNLTIPGYGGEELEVSVYDLAGKLVYTGMVSASSKASVEVNVGFRPVAGNYIVSVKGINTSLSRQITFK